MVRWTYVSVPFLLRRACVAEVSSLGQSGIKLLPFTMVLTEFDISSPVPYQTFVEQFNSTLYDIPIYVCQCIAFTRSFVVPETSEKYLLIHLIGFCK